MTEELMLVEPDVDILDSLTKFFSRNGYSITIAKNGSECIRELKRRVPDLMLLEPALPCDWGSKVLAVCGQFEVAGHLPVVALSRRSPGLVTFPFRAYHVKPTSLHVLLDSIEAILRCKTHHYPGMQE